MLDELLSEAEAAVRAAHEKGRRSVLDELHAAAALNGTLPAVVGRLDAGNRIAKAFIEAQHPRDRTGKWIEKGDIDRLSHSKEGIEHLLNIVRPQDREAMVGAIHAARNEKQHGMPNVRQPRDAADESFNQYSREKKPPGSAGLAQTVETVDKAQRVIARAKEGLLGGDPKRMERMLVEFFKGLPPQTLKEFANHVDLRPGLANRPEHTPETLAKYVAGGGNLPMTEAPKEKPKAAAPASEDPFGMTPATAADRAKFYDKMRPNDALDDVFSKPSPVASKPVESQPLRANDDLDAAMGHKEEPKASAPAKESEAEAIARRAKEYRDKQPKFGPWTADDLLEAAKPLQREMETHDPEEFARAAHEYGQWLKQFSPEELDGLAKALGHDQPKGDHGTLASKLAYKALRPATADTPDEGHTGLVHHDDGSQTKLHEGEVVGHVPAGESHPPATHELPAADKAAELDKAIPAEPASPVSEIANHLRNPTSGMRDWQQVRNRLAVRLTNPDHLDAVARQVLGDDAVDRIPKYQRRDKLLDSLAGRAGARAEALHGPVKAKNDPRTVAERLKLAHDTQSRLSRENGMFKNDHIAQRNFKNLRAQYAHEMEAHLQEHPELRAEYGKYTSIHDANPPKGDDSDRPANWVTRDEKGNPIQEPKAAPSALASPGASGEGASSALSPTGTTRPSPGAPTHGGRLRGMSTKPDLDMPEPGPADVGAFDDAYKADLKDMADDRDDHTGNNPRRVPAALNLSENMMSPKILKPAAELAARARLAAGHELEPSILNNFPHLAEKELGKAEADRRQAALKDVKAAGEQHEKNRKAAEELSYRIHEAEQAKENGVAGEPIAIPGNPKAELGEVKRYFHQLVHETLPGYAQQARDALVVANGGKAPAPSPDALAPVAPEAAPKHPEQSLLESAHELGAQQPHGMAKISDMRKRFEQEHPNATREDFDEHLLNLRRTDKLRLISISDRSRATKEELGNGVQSVGENFFWAEPPAAAHEAAPVAETAPTPAPKKKRSAPSSAVVPGSIHDVVRSYGGLDPDAFERNHGDRTENGIPPSAFRGKDGRKGTQHLDSLAQELLTTGDLSPHGEDVTPHQHLWNALSEGRMSAHADQGGAQDHAGDEIERQLQGLRDTEKTPAHSEASVSLPPRITKPKDWQTPPTDANVTFPEAGQPARFHKLPDGRIAETWTGGNGRRYVRANDGKEGAPVQVDYTGSGQFNPVDTAPNHPLEEEYRPPAEGGKALDMDERGKPVKTAPVAKPSASLFDTPSEVASEPAAPAFQMNPPTQTGPKRGPTPQVDWKDVKPFPAEPVDPMADLEKSRANPHTINRYENKESGIESHVHAEGGGKYSASLWDTESGKKVGPKTTFPSQERAEQAAKSWANIKDKPKTTEPAPKTVTQAANELQRIRNTMTDDHDRDEVQARVDQVGKFLADQKNSPTVSKLLEEAHSISDRLAGGSGKRGNRLAIKTDESHSLEPAVREIQEKRQRTGEPPLSERAVEHLEEMAGAGIKIRSEDVAAAQGTGIPHDAPVAPKGKPKQAPTKPERELPPVSPHIALSNQIATELKAGTPLTAKDVFTMADRTFGGTRAQGKYGPSDAYDALEAGFNKALRGETDPRLDTDAAIAQAEELAKRVGQLPTQTNRSGNKDALQQFSTPPHYAYAANWVANLTPGETVLEPSAGTNSLGVHAQNAGATVVGNELDPNRREHLADQIGAGNVHGENAEQIGAILKNKVSPSTVVMNPPFSQTAGRLGDKTDTMTGAKHIEEAMSLLQPNGRLVAIVGRGMSPDSPTFKNWFAKMKGKYSLRANVGVGGDEYKKYGTSFGTRMLVFDKTGPHTGGTVSGDAEDIPDLMRKLEGVRNDRPEVAGPAPGQQVGGEVPEERGGAGGSDPNAPVATPGALAGRGRDKQQLPVRELFERSEDASVPVVGQEPGVAGGAANPELGQPDERMGGQVAGPEAAVTGKPVGRTVRRTPSANAPVEGGGGVAGGEPVQQPASSGPGLRPASRVGVRSVNDPSPGSPTADPPSGPGVGPAQPATNAELGDSLFEPYTPPLLRVEGAQKHQTPLVESAAMSSVKPPEPTYKPHLSPDLISGKKIKVLDSEGKVQERNAGLSDVQLEGVVGAGQAHEQFLPAVEGQEPVRRGHFNGDGTGVGKGRQVAGIIMDNMNQGRKKHVWVSQKWDLMKDAQRDWQDMGGKAGDIFDSRKMLTGKGKGAPSEGIAFINYDTLKGEGEKTSDPSKKTNMEKLVEWLGPDFDGTVTFDEAHKMGNATDTEGERGTRKASDTAVAGVQLQKLLPKARVSYFSATGASEVANLAYAERLGLWGKGTAFPSKKDFIASMEQGGLAAMETVAQSLKATGGYISRSLAMNDGTERGSVQYEPLNHDLTPDQVEQYNAASDAWQEVLKNIDAALEITGGKANGKERGAKRAQFFGAQLRFYDQVMTSMMVPTIIKSMESDLENGRSPVLQFVNTGAAGADRADAKRQEGEDVDDMDVTPKEGLMTYLRKSFPTERFEEYQDENGNTRTRKVIGSDGLPVHDPEAVALREQMLDRVGSLRGLEGALDQLVKHFGHDKIAEATGRTRRRIWEKDPKTGELKGDWQNRKPGVNPLEAAAFQSGKKRIMAFSGAGGTGSSYHADKAAGNQDRRTHYMLQPGWQPAPAVQGLGRTHRTNQSSAPIVILPQIPLLKGQKRMMSGIAAKMDTMGALTRGQRSAGSGGLFKAADNLMTPQAQEAVNQFFTDLQRGDVPGLEYRDTMQQLGFDIPEDNLNKNKGRGSRGKGFEPPAVSQFLNRIMATRVDKQNQIFQAFEDRHHDAIQKAADNGTLDTGMENYPAESVTEKASHVIHKDPASGAEARLMVAQVKRKVEKKTFDEIRKKSPQSFQGFAKNKETGEVRAVFKGPDQTSARTGQVVQTYRLDGPSESHRRYVAQSRVHMNPEEYGADYKDFHKVDEDEARAAWDKEHAEIPNTRESEEHFITGAILPIWDRIPGDKPKIYRMRTTQGNTIVGRHVDPEGVPAMKQNFGIGEAAKDYDAEGAHARLANGHSLARLANGWKLKPVRVQGERRIEIVGPSLAHERELTGDGIIKERIAYNTRYFVPTGEGGADVLRRITEHRPIVEVRDV